MVETSLHVLVDSAYAKKPRCAVSGGLGAYRDFGGMMRNETKKVNGHERIGPAETRKQETEASTEESGGAAEQVERCLDGGGDAEGKKEEAETQAVSQRRVGAHRHALLGLRSCRIDLLSHTPP